MNLLDADGLSGKDLAEIDFFIAQTDAATAGDHDGFVVKGIVDVQKTWTKAHPGPRFISIPSLFSLYANVGDLPEVLAAMRQSTK